MRLLVALAIAGLALAACAHDDYRPSPRTPPSQTPPPPPPPGPGAA